MKEELEQFKQVWTLENIIALAHSMISAGLTKEQTIEVIQHTQREVANNLLIATVEKSYQDLLKQLK